MTRTAKFLILTVSAASLGACSAHTSGKHVLNDHAPSFGQAVKANMAAQAIAPTPEQKANTYIPADRSRRELARKRYREDKVEQPVALTTTN